ncbi:MAG: efflux RND transporter periplasmic adaptor subunit [Candidatus Omnitrophica bacterium]|nr:efflux RND transporter periplasmic adaptor subunit [Candidatus Omnitrophota bacterium]
MNSRKMYLLIGAFILFWIVFISWGMFKTNIKLAQEKLLPQFNKGAKEEIKPGGQPAGPGGGEQGKTSEAPREGKKLTDLMPPEEPPPLMVRVFKVKPVNFQDNLPVMGTVKGKTEIPLKFEVSGVINKINFREGEKIKKGDVIACIDPKDVQLKYVYAKNKFNSAQASANSAKKRLEVFQKLYDAGAILKTKLEEIELEYEAAKYQVETARSEMDLAENELGKTCIAATKEGVMGPREAEEGQFITPQDKAGTLFEIKEVFVEVGVVERDIDKIKIGQKAKVFVDAFQNIPFDGTVAYIFPVVEGKSRTLTIKIKVDNPESQLLPGMFSRAEILLHEVQNALIVPMTSLYPTGNIYRAPVIPAETLRTDEDGFQTGRLEMRTVTVPYKTSDYAQVSEGMKANDYIVTEVQGEFKDKAKVKIVGTEEGSF